jgi:hypothetical protein
LHSFFETQQNIVIYILKDRGHHPPEASAAFYHPIEIMAILLIQAQAFLSFTPISAGILVVAVSWLIYVRLH